MAYRLTDSTLSPFGWDDLFACRERDGLECIITSFSVLVSTAIPCPIFNYLAVDLRVSQQYIFCGCVHLPPKLERRFKATVELLMDGDDLLLLSIFSSLFGPLGKCSIMCFFRAYESI